MINVLMPCYQHSHFLPRALESIRHQSDVYITILNDEPGCDLSPYESLPGVSVFQDGKRKGQGVRKNEGIERAIQNGALYITVNDADDTSMDYRIEMLQYYNDGADILYTDCVTTKQGRPTGYITSKEFDIEALKDNNYIVGATGFISVKFLMSSGVRFRENLMYGEDWLLWHDAYKAGAKFAYLPMPTINYSLDTSSVKIRNTDKWGDEKFKLKNTIKEMYRCHQHKEER